jgi:uncharacterized protein YbdZ (MbtH family)
MVGENSTTQLFSNGMSCSADWDVAKLLTPKLSRPQIHRKTTTCQIVVAILGRFVMWPQHCHIMVGRSNACNRSSDLQGTRQFAKPPHLLKCQLDVF